MRIKGNNHKDIFLIEYLKNGAFFKVTAILKSNISKTARFLLLRTIV